MGLGWPHLTSCLPSLGSLGKAVVLGLPPPPGYAITQNLPAAPKPHTEFPNKTCENRSPVAASATFGNCPCPRSTSRLLSPRRCPLQMQTKPGWTLSLRPIQESSARELMDSVLFFWLHPNQMELNVHRGPSFCCSTGSYLCNGAGRERLSRWLPGLVGVLNLHCFLHRNQVLMSAPPPHSFRGRWPCPLSV